MFNLSFANAKSIVTNSLGRTGLILSKHSPAILLGFGIASGVAAAVLACHETLKLADVTEFFETKFDKIEETKDKNPDKYSITDYKHDRALTQVSKSLAILRLYAPSLALGAVSVGLILGSHHILSERNVALAAAYAAIDEGFKAYRKRVVDDAGESKDRQYRYGIKSETVTETSKDENGKKVKTTKIIESIDQDYQPSIYAKFFDKLSCQWSRSPEHNLFFLKNSQNWANEVLKSRGHVFLNEVYDQLDIPRTKEGAIVGWIKYGGTGDDYIDFDIYNPRNANRDFVNGYNDSVLLDFNVDGIIYDKI